MYYFSHCQNIILNIYWHYLDCVTQSIEGRCSKIGNRCWCLHKRGTPGSSVCGYASGYNGEYYSIASDGYRSALTIIQAFGMPPTSNCKQDTNAGCQGNCASNICNSFGCTGTDQSCKSNYYRWSRTDGDGFVRCTNMEA